MALKLFARNALLAEGWADKVRLTVQAGRIESIASGVAAEPGDTRLGVVVPGVCNAHSHAFQRALVGHAERRSPAGKDNFWSWRSLMYAIANRIDARLLEAIAAQAFVEMLESGYTSVAEFHYLHDAPATNNNAMFRALQSAAGQSGIRLNYVPVLYERAGFDEAQPAAHQQRFVLSLDAFIDHQQRCGQQSNDTLAVSIGVHSLRAVTPSSLRAIAELAAETNVPMHLHIAEQAAEVEQCVAAYGARPVAWLLDAFDVDERWCLVHATHLDAAETEALAKSAAVACLCPSTEGNLGDGLFPLQSFLEHGGRIAIGSDSQVTIDPFEELRWLEYGQRLATQSRNVSENLFARVLEGGTSTGHHVTGAIEEGAPADLVALDADDAVLLGHDDRSRLDALVFSGRRVPIDRVMVHGDWRVTGGRHVDRARVHEDFRQALEQLR